MRQYHAFIRVPMLVVMQKREGADATEEQAREFAIECMAKAGFPRCTILEMHPNDELDCTLADWEPDTVALARPV